MIYVRALFQMEDLGMEKNSQRETYILPDTEVVDTDRIDRILLLLSSLFDGFCAKGHHDRRYVAALLEEFGEFIDVEDELRQFHAWMLDHGSEDKQQYRSRFRSWLKRARRPQYARN